MECRRCGHETTMVKEKRSADGFNKRRRECPVCGAEHRFTTYEVYARAYPGRLHRDKGKNRGEKNGNAYMTAVNIIEIRRLYHVEKMSIRQIADKLKVPYCTIRNIITGRSWSHVPHQDYTLRETNRTFQGRGATKKPAKATPSYNALFLKQGQHIPIGREKNFESITEQAVIEMRRLYHQEGVTLTALTKRFKRCKLTWHNAYKIVNYKSWKDVKSSLYDPTDFYPLG